MPKKMTNLELSIIIVNFNTKSLTADCLASIRKFPPQFDYEVVVVDNGSTDGSVEALSQDKGINLIANSRNLGFSKATNQGIKIAQGKYLLLLNSDTRVTGGAVAKLLEFARDTPDAGVVAARLLNADGSVQPSLFRFPSVWRAIRQYWLGQKGLLDKFAPTSDRPVKVEVATMAAFLITPVARQKIGRLAEKYFFYFEDFDYCRRVARAGLTVYYLPTARVYHYHGASGKELADSANQWRRLTPSSKIYHGLVMHYLFNFVVWSGQNLPIGLIIMLAFLLRVLWLPKNLFFGFEQGRDFLKLAEIAGGNPALIGPGTDIPGIFHGALSYYVPLPFFLLFSGNPLWVQVSFIAINSLAIYLLYRTIVNLFNNRVALAASVFYAVSYSSLIYSRWLSNPTLVPALTIGVLYSLVKARQRAWYLVAVAVFWSVIFHLELVAALTLALPIIIFVVVEKVKVPLKIALGSLAVVAVILSSYLVFDLKNEYILSTGVKNYLSAPKVGVYDFSGSVDQFANEIRDNLFPLDRNVALVLFWGLVVTALFNRRNGKASRVVLAFLLISPLAYLLYAMRPQRHFYITTPIFLAILVGIFVDSFSRLKFRLLSVSVIALICLANSTTMVIRFPKREANFIYHAQYMYFKDEVELMDVVYRDAGGAPFSYDYYIIPYWKREPWDYLFTWHGQGKYGYLPSTESTPVFYVFIEPDETQKPYQDEWYEKLTIKSKLIATYYSGKLRAEKRIRR